MTTSPASATDADVHPDAPGPRVPAPALVLLAIASVQCGAAIATTLFPYAGATGTVLMRLGFSALMLLVALRPRFWTWPRESIVAAVTLGLTLGAMNLTFYLAIRTVPLGVAVTLEFLGPLMVTLVQTRRWRDLAWALLATAGVALLGLSGGDTAPVSGMAWALAAGGFWAIYILASARVGRLVPGTDGLAVALAVAALLVLPFGASGVAGVLDRPAVLLGGVAVAILSSLLPYSLELAALRHLPTRVFGILMSLEPAGGALAGLLIVGQLLAPTEVLALVLVSVASAGATLGRRQRAETAAPTDHAVPRPEPEDGADRVTG
ncbi:MAG: EamA family transporter [Actinobacteria bacterium]|nr:EamA family transporter [Actinomycetota bacterium]